MVERDALEDFIADVGTKAAKAGFTTSQVGLHPRACIFSLPQCFAYSLAQSRVKPLLCVIHEAMFLMTAWLCDRACLLVPSCDCVASMVCCGMQVMAKISAERPLPPHNPDATTAAEAFPFSAIVAGPSTQHLEVGYLMKALRNPSHLRHLRSTDVHRKKVDVFVDSVLERFCGDDGAAGLSDEQANEVCHWLALYNTCRKMSRVRPGTHIALPDVLQEDDAGISDEDVLTHVRSFVALARLLWVCCNGIFAWPLRRTKQNRMPTVCTC